MFRKTILTAAILSLPLAAAAEEPEIQAIQRDAAPEQVERKLSPERQRLQDILDTGREEVLALSAQLEKAVSQQQRHAIQLQIVTAKQAHRMRFLEEKLVIAEEKGDEAEAQMARRQLESLEAQITQSKKQNVLVPRPVPQEGNR